MNRCCLLIPMSLAVVLLTGCPDNTKLPSPTPKVPQPKLESGTSTPPAAAPASTTPRG